MKAKTALIPKYGGNPGPISGSNAPASFPTVDPFRAYLNGVSVRMADFRAQGDWQPRIDAQFTACSTKAGTMPLPQRCAALKSAYDGFKKALDSCAACMLMPVSGAATCIADKRGMDLAAGQVGCPNVR